MRKTVSSVTSLLGGGGVFIAGNSLLGIVLPLRMEAAGYPTAHIGAIMATYYAGLAFGGLHGKRLILRFGHIRAFSAFAAVAATAALIYPFAFTPFALPVLRFVSGFCMAGLTATIESWLNARTANSMRGRVLALYMVTNYLAIAAGQLLINFADMAGPELFMVAAVLLTLALVPVALTRQAAPSLDGHRSVTARQLLASSPIGMAGAGVAGLLVGSFYALGAIFARGMGFGVAGAAAFMTAVVAGGFAFQMPIGMAADRFDRRAVLIVVLTTLAGAWSLVAGSEEVALRTLLAVAFVFGGAISSIYPICVAETFDRLDRDRYVAASGRLLTVYSSGAMLGPVIASVLMSAAGPRSFFVFESVVAVGFAVLVAISMARRPPLPAQDQESFVPLPDVTPLAANLDPRADGKPCGQGPADGGIPPLEDPKIVAALHEPGDKKSGLPGWKRFSHGERSRTSEFDVQS